MPRTLIRYDASNMMHKSVGRHGATPQQIQANQSALKRAKATLLKDWKQGTQGWLGCPEDSQLLTEIHRIVQEKKHFTTCLVIGIGGSDLGARAAYQALKHTGKGMTLEFAGGNTDPDELEEILSRLDLSKTVVNIISKSGDTVEPMSTFFVVRELLKKKFGKSFSHHIVATTDADCGSLRALADREGYDTLPIPKNIGGRFSVLTAVGLFPLACAGIDIKKILQGAASVRDEFRRKKDDIASQHALHQYLADQERRQHIHVLMPYSSRIEQFGRWYRQIWAESLGKKTNLDGDTVNVGPTPVAALGVTDQHSQIQLYVEGPNDKTVTFIEVEKFDSSLSVPTGAKDIKPLAYLSKIPFSRIIHAERKGTAEALRLANRPNGTLSIPGINPETVGALFMFFQIATGICGELYGINTYNQPGVEEGKRVASTLLKRKTSH